MIAVKSTTGGHAAHFRISFTIVTYNCLASNLAEPKYFPQTNSSHLNFSYRSKLLGSELQSFDADIVCVQEIHLDDFHQWLRPFLSPLGYCEGVFAERGGDKAKDGVVIFFKRDKFKLIERHRLSYFDCARAQFPTGTSLATYNVALFCLLEVQNTEENQARKEKQQIWICNTHLNWNDKLLATQFFQIRTLINELARLNGENQKKPCVIVGDFNSLSNSVVHDYIRNGFLVDTADYYSAVYEVYLPLFGHDAAKAKNYLMTPHAYKGLLESAYSDSRYSMPFSTRVVNKTCKTIDYIYYNRAYLHPLELLDALHNDGDRALQNDFTLPNENHPSDHLPLMARLGLFLPYSDDFDENKCIKLDSN